jgi:hypothetical protein
MSYHISWLIEGRLIKVAFVDHVSIDDVRNYAADLKAALDSGSAPVHMIHDMSKLASFHTNINEIRTTVAPAYRHPAIGWNINVDARVNPLKNFISTVVLKFFGIKSHTTLSEEAAVEWLSQMDSTILQQTS